VKTSQLYGTPNVESQLLILPFHFFLLQPVAAMLRCRHRLAVAATCAATRSSRPQEPLVLHARGAWRRAHAAFGTGHVAAGVAGGDKAATAPPPPPSPAATVAAVQPPSVSERAMLGTLAQHLWPSGPDSSGLKTRVVASVGLLLASKVLTIQVRQRSRCSKCTSAPCSVPRPLPRA
jgi:hypothetical protein